MKYRTLHHLNNGLLTVTLIMTYALYRVCAQCNVYDIRVCLHSGYVHYFIVDEGIKQSAYSP